MSPIHPPPPSGSSTWSPRRRRCPGLSHVPAGLLSVLCARLLDPRVGDSLGARPSVSGFSYAASVSQVHPWGSASGLIPIPAVSCPAVWVNRLLSLSHSWVDGPVGGFHCLGAGPCAALSVCVRSLWVLNHMAGPGLSLLAMTLPWDPPAGSLCESQARQLSSHARLPSVITAARLCLPPCCPGTGVGRVGGCPLSPLGKGRFGDWEEGPDESPLRRSVPQRLKVGSSVAAVSSSRCCPWSQ